MNINDPRILEMDFVSDQLYNGKRSIELILIDTYSSECLEIYADKSIRGNNVVEILEKLKTGKGLPKKIKADNVPEFTSRSLDARTYITLA